MRWKADSPTVFDSNCVTYLLDALVHASRPGAVDKLATQKLALVRVLFYGPHLLAYTDTVRAEVASISDTLRRDRHLNALDVHFRELSILDPSRAESERSRLTGAGINSKDARWMGEALAHDAPLIVTWDRGLLGQARRAGESRVQSPATAYATLGIGVDSPLRTRPVAANPLSGQSWWRL